MKSFNSCEVNCKSLSEMTYLGSLCAANSIRITSIVFIAKVKFKGVELTLIHSLVLLFTHYDGRFGIVWLHWTAGCKIKIDVASQIFSAGQFGTSTNCVHREQSQTRRGQTHSAEQFGTFYYTDWLCLKEAKSSLIYSQILSDGHFCGVQTVSIEG